MRSPAWKFRGCFGRAALAGCSFRRFPEVGEWRAALRWLIGCSGLSRWPAFMQQVAIRRTLSAAPAYSFIQPWHA